MRRTKKFLAALLVCHALPNPAYSAEFWWPYIASYDTGPGSIRVDLRLYKTAPLTGFPHLVITGTTYATGRSDGLPEIADLPRLNALSDKIVTTIQATTPSVYAGTFTNNREQLNYVYVKETGGIPVALAKLYAQACENCKIYTNIKQDPSWSAYRDFLYPNQATRDFYGEEWRKIIRYLQ